MRDGVRAQAKAAIDTTLLMVAVAFTIAAILTWLILDRVRSALTNLHNSLNAMAAGSGNLREALSVSGECVIGRTSHAFNGFVAGLRELVILARSNAEQVSCVVALGTTIPSSPVRLTATGSPPPIGTTSTASVLCVLPGPNKSWPLYPPCKKRLA